MATIRHSGEGTPGGVPTTADAVSLAFDSINTDLSTGAVTYDDTYAWSGTGSILFDAPEDGYASATWSTALDFSVGALRFYYYFEETFSNEIFTLLDGADIAIQFSQSNSNVTVTDAAAFNVSPGGAVGLNAWNLVELEWDMPAGFWHVQVRDATTLELHTEYTKNDATFNGLAPSTVMWNKVPTGWFGVDKFWLDEVLLTNDGSTALGAWDPGTHPLEPEEPEPEPEPPPASDRTEIITRWTFQGGDVSSMANWK